MHVWVIEVYISQKNQCWFQVFVLECYVLTRKIQNFYPWKKIIPTRKEGWTCPYEFYILHGADTPIAPRLESFSSISQTVPNSQMVKVHSTHFVSFTILWILFSVLLRNFAAF